MKIMVVEDAEDSRILLEDLLRVNGYEVDSACNGVEALEKSKKFEPNLIISDILMPEMDGFEFCQHIKLDPSLRSIPFVFYTATYTDSSDEQLAMSLGASRFVVKPKDPVEFVKIIREVISTENNNNKNQSQPAEANRNILDKHIRVLNKKIFSKIEMLEKAEEDLKLAAMVFKISSEGMMVTDADNNIIAINPAFTAITGYVLEDVRNQNPSILSSGKHDMAFYMSMWEQLLKTDMWQGELWDKRKNGEVYPKWLSINIVRDKQGLIYRYIAIFSDISDKKKSEEVIWRQANFDSLTDLPNRDRFREIIKLEIAKSNDDNNPTALLLLDVDLFKEVNDTLGHDVGDSLLQEAAKRIVACVRDADTVARMGGDEFAVVLSSITDTKDIDDIAHKISSMLAEPYKLGNEVVYVTASIGITIYPDDTQDIDTLIKNADQAMYAAKKKGRNQFNYFTRSMQVKALTRLRISNDLRCAVEDNQLRINVQPIVDCTTGQVKKAEALVRWHHPGRGVIGPTDFIPIAEDTGLIHEIGDWVFKEAAKWVKDFISQYGEDFQVSINLSPIQFRNRADNFVEEWLDFLQILGLSGKNIVIEITESLLLNAENGVKEQLMQLRKAGIQIAIDDFGTGYSSLSYLKKFEIDYIKIDQSFISNLETDKNDIALIEAIIVMSHKLGLSVIAEGVETDGQEELLVESGCDYAQGYLYSRPTTLENFPEVSGLTQLSN